MESIQPLLMHIILSLDHTVSLRSYFLDKQQECLLSMRHMAEDSELKHGEQFTQAEEMLLTILGESPSLEKVPVVFYQFIQVVSVDNFFLLRDSMQQFDFFLGDLG